MRCINSILHAGGVTEATKAFMNIPSLYIEPISLIIKNVFTPQKKRRVFFDWYRLFALFEFQTKIHEHLEASPSKQPNHRQDGESQPESFNAIVIY